MLLMDSMIRLTGYFMFADGSDDIFILLEQKRAIRYVFWIVGFIAMAGNAYVIVSSCIKTRCFKKAWPSASLQCNHIVIFNIAVADFIMGIYLIAISITDLLEGISFLPCVILGSFAVISSEASCFLMVTLTSFRMFHVCRPLSSMTASSWPWKVCIFMSWLVAVFMGFCFSLFVSRCLPNFYVPNNFGGWEYTIAIITLNFTSFVFVAVGYIVIYIQSIKKRPINAANTAELQKREAKMQRRIAIIIMTDCACWVPICIMGFATLGGWRPSEILYDVTVAFLLPINSMLNPFLYSINLSKLFKSFRCRPIKKCRN